MKTPIFRRAPLAAALLLGLAANSAFAGQTCDESLGTQTGVATLPIVAGQQPVFDGNGHHALAGEFLGQKVDATRRARAPGATVKQQNRRARPGELRGDDECRTQVRHRTRKNVQIPQDCGHADYRIALLWSFFRLLPRLV